MIIISDFILLQKAFTRVFSANNYNHQKEIGNLFSASVLLLITAFLAGCATAPKANLALGQMSTGNPQKAWEMISTELDHPTVSSKENLCEVHIAAIKILTTIVHYEFAPSDPDGVAKKSYDYVSKNCGEIEWKQGIAENLYGVYFQRTKRPGQAISHIKKAILLATRTYGRMVNENNLAVAYAEMGQFELRDFHRRKAIAIGDEYFKTRRTYKYSLDEFGERTAYKNILEYRMDDLSSLNSRTGALPEMHALWDKISAINAGWLSRETQYLAYLYAAQQFAIAGDTMFGRKLLNEAKITSAKYAHTNKEGVKADIQSAEARILIAEGRYKEASSLWQDWINKFERLSGKSLNENDFRIVGLAQELAENYDSAIEYLEKAIWALETRRSSFEVKSRGQFLSGSVVTTYWGLTRSYAGRYLKDRNEADFQSAVRAERMLRARQFGEMTGIAGKGSSDFNISALRLKADELLLDYVFTDSAIVILAISPDWHDLFLIPYDSKNFGDTLKRVRSQLSIPADVHGYIDDLQKISEAIIPQPIADRLSKVKKLIVMPDGYLTGIPFAIISKSSHQYTPMIRDHEVVLTPSISYLMAQRDSKEQVNYDKGMLALADPAYGPQDIPEAYMDDTKVFYTRAVSDFNLFTPLPETRIEVERISQLLGAENNTLLIGNKASKANLKMQQLKGFRYLHFATHGVLGNQIPNVYEPALVVAADNSGGGNFLLLSEIEGLELNNDLTVLSACDTGSGRYYTGEGVMGLSRGFLVAGSKSVLASLWPIDSMSTVDFMIRFYQHLRSGKSKAQALRLVQLELIGNTKESKASIERGISVSDKVQQPADMAHPYYWAAFVLTGE